MPPLSITVPNEIVGIQTQPAAEPDDDEEPVDTPELVPTIDELRPQGDPNEVDRTPVLSPSDVPVRAGEWPLGFPLQGIPRAGVTFSLQYVYDEEKEEWERDTGNARIDRGPLQAQDAPQPSVSTQANTVATNSGNQPTVDVSVS